MKNYCFLCRAKHSPRVKLGNLTKLALPVAPYQVESLSFSFKCLPLPFPKDANLESALPRISVFWESVSSPHQGYSESWLWLLSSSEICEMVDNEDFSSSTPLLGKVLGSGLLGVTLFPLELKCCLECVTKKLGIRLYPLRDFKYYCKLGIMYSCRDFSGQMTSRSGLHFLEATWSRKSRA